MTPQEAIKRIEAHNEIHSKNERFAVHITEALKLAIKALKKQIPIEHHHTKLVEGYFMVRESICPSCLGVIITTEKERPKHCTWCGQKIDWSDK